MTYTDQEVREHREQWLAELRSGNRQQVRGYLACPSDDGDGVGFCCLGVATDMAGLTHEDVTAPGSRSLQYRRYFGINGGDYLTLPHEAREWLGVSAGDPALDFAGTDEDFDFLREVLDDDVYDNIADAVRPGSGNDLTGAALNDSGASFKQIADLFEHFGFDPKHDLLPQEVAA